MGRDATRCALPPYSSAGTGVLPAVAKCCQVERLFFSAAGFEVTLEDRGHRTDQGRFLPEPAVKRSARARHPEASPSSHRPPHRRRLQYRCLTASLQVGNRGPGQRNGSHWRGFNALVHLHGPSPETSLLTCSACKAGWIVWVGRLVVSRYCSVEMSS
jgi:hypothetical protein